MTPAYLWHDMTHTSYQTMGWLRLVGSWKLYLSLENIGLFCRALLQKRPRTLRSLLIVATPYEVSWHGAFVCVHDSFIYEPWLLHMCDMTWLMCHIRLRGSVTRRIRMYTVTPLYMCYDSSYGWHDMTHMSYQITRDQRACRTGLFRRAGVLQCVVV